MRDVGRQMDDESDSTKQRVRGSQTMSVVEGSEWSDARDRNSPDCTQETRRQM